MNGQLTKKILISGTITAKTGLHIGGSNVGLSIGGADATVVRNPLTNEPYIPGSSLKGKMRSLLEKVYSINGFGPSIGEHIKNGPFTEYVKAENGIKEEQAKSLNSIIDIFGTMPEKMKNEMKPTSRLIVRDCEMKYTSVSALSNSKDTDMPYTEVKTEVVIDRITSAATPRQLERVPAGAVFNMRMILNVYDGDEEKELLNKVFEGLALVQNDYLGGKGTRGSGEVKINIDSVMYKDKDSYEKLSNWKEFNETDKVEIPKELQKENEEKK